MTKIIDGFPYIKRRNFLRMLGGVSLSTLVACGDRVQQGGQSKADYSKPMIPPVKVTMLRSQAVAQAAFYIAEERGYFRDEGLEVEAQPSLNASDALVLLNSGQVDFVPATLSAALLNASAAGLNLRVLMSFAYIASGDGSSGIVVRKKLIESGAYKSMADLRKRKFAVASEGTTSGYIADIALRKAGLTLNDVELVSLPYPDISVALTNGAVDAAQLTEPFSTILRQRGIVEQVAVSGDLAPGLPTGVLLASQKFLTERPEVAQRVVTAALRGARDYHQAFDLNQGGREQILSMFVKYTSIKDPKLLKEIGLPHVDPDGRFDVAAVDRMQDFFIARSAQKVRADLNKLVESRFLDAAIAHLAAGTPKVGEKN